MKFTLAALLMMLAAAARAEPGAVIIAAGSAAPPMDAQQVRRLFLGRETEVGGKPAVVIYQKDGKAKDLFESKVLNKSGADLTGYWAKLIFTGRARAPEEFSGDAKVKAAVLSIPGAVGYVDDAAIDDTVKVLFRF